MRHGISGAFKRSWTWKRNNFTDGTAFVVPSIFVKRPVFW